MMDVRLGAGPAEVLRSVLDALSGGPHGDIAGRRRIYSDLLAEGLLAEAEIQNTPGAPGRDVAGERFRQLRVAINLVEADIRAGVDVFADGYSPKGLEDALRKQPAAREKQADPSAEAPLVVEPDELLAVLLADLSKVQHGDAVERRKIYNSFRDRYERGLGSRNLPADTAEVLRGFMRVVIRLVDTDIRAGVDVFAESYAPPELTDRLRRLRPSQAVAVVRTDDAPLAVEPPQFLATVLDALSRVRHDQAADRRTVYNSLRERYDSGLSGRDLSPEVAESYRSFFRVVIRIVDVDIRAGVNVFAEEYRPAEIQERLRKLASTGDTVPALAQDEPLVLDPDDFLPAVLEGLSHIPLDQPGDRRKVYNSLRDRLERGLALRNLPKETAEFHRRLFSLVVRLVETDIRAGLDIFAPGYSPEELTEHFSRMDVGHRRSAMQRKAAEAREIRRRSFEEDIYHEVELRPGESTAVESLRWRLTYLHARPQPYHLRDPRLRSLALIVPLLVFQLQTIQAESRVALVWNFVAPAILLTLISSLYFLAGYSFILNMDVPTFALLGATTWIMFRQIIFRSSTSFLSSRPMMNFSAVTPLLAAISIWLVYQTIYVFVFAILLFGGYSIGMVSLTTNWFPFIGLVLMFGMGGLSLGLMFGSVAVNWPFFLRFAPAIERVLEVFSAVFFVSEQLPEEYRPYFLWSPFAHGMQLIRSSYFPGYKSVDVSFGYFFVSLILLIAVGVAAERYIRSDVQPM